MSHLQETYAYHRQLEPLGVFLRYQRKTILLAGCAFAALMLAAILLIDPAFFYPRVQTDPLNYWLKAKQLVEHGNTAARWAVNVPPFPYAAMPGILRTPALLLSHEFDTQLRIMQLMNIPIAAGVAIMSAYILSWSQPRHRHAAVILFAFAFMILTPVWMANLLLPLVDAPYAFFTLAAVLLARAIVCSDDRLRDQKLNLSLFAVFFAISFGLRFTAPAVILFAGVLARGRWSHGSIPRRTMFIAAGAAIALTGILVLANAEAIFGRYFSEPLFFLRDASKPAMIANLLGVALPSQIIPGFSLGFTQPPIEGLRTVHFAETARDTAWLVVGFAISTVILTGMWRMRRRLLAEVVYVLVPMPLLALVLPSTTRYVMTYEPFLWLFFYFGAVALGQRLHIDGKTLARNRLALSAIAVAAACGVIGLRMWRSAGTAGPQSVAIRLTRAPDYISDVSRTFRHLRAYLETLPRDSVLLVGQWGTSGRWSLISGMRYYYPDSGLTAAARLVPVYVLAECGTQETCQIPGELAAYVRKQIGKWGDFTYKREFIYVTPNANAQVYRIIPR